MESFSGHSTPQQRFIALIRNEGALLQRASSGSIHEREVALTEILAERERNQDLFFPAATGNREVIDFARTRVILAAESGVLNASMAFPVNPRPHRTEMVTAENHPELHRQTLEMNRQLNERHGTHYAPPDVLLVDNNNQIPLYSELADMIVISRRTLEQGNAPAMIAHELAERQGQLTRGDMRLNQEFNLRRDLGLAQPTGTLERHRVNECREDAEAIVLVGPDAYQRAFHSELSPLPHNTDELNYISDGLLRGNASEHYPAILDRLRMVATFRDNPELLARFRNNPQAIQLDGSCNITEVEARGAGTARAPQQVGNDPAQAR